jgi:PKD repeat protein
MKRLIAGLLVVIILIGTVSCAESAPEAVPEPAPAPVPAPESSRSGLINWAGEDSSVESIEQAPAPVIEIPAPAEPGKGVSDYDESLIPERMIVRTGEMALVVTDVLDTLEQIVELADRYDGYVVSSNSWREGDSLVGSISIRVDAANFDNAIRSLRNMAVEVNYESTTSKDVTEEYVDLSAQLSNLELSEAQLRELMERAGTVEEILAVQRDLSDVRGEIERTKGRMQYLEQTSSTSLINVQLQQAELDVNFSASSRTVKVGQNVRFDPDIGGGISPFSYEWDFGDGETSTEVAPGHEYKSDGNYNVTLKVTDDKGQTASKERKNYIDVMPGWSAGKVVSGAWNGLVGLGHVLFTIVIWIIYFIPLWIIIGVILYFAWWRRRKKASGKDAS